MEIILIVYFSGLFGTLLGYVMGNCVRSQYQEKVVWLLIIGLFWPIFTVALMSDILLYVWRKITMSKTLMYMFVLLVILVFLGICTYANAAPFKISPPVNVFYPVTYPDKVANMTDVEFYKWATAKNKKSRADWQEKYLNAGDKYLIHRRRITKSRYTGMGNINSVIMTGGKLGNPGGESFTQQYKSTYRYRNPDFRHPGPLTIINSYFRVK